MILVTPGAAEDFAEDLPVTLAVTFGETDEEDLLD